MRVAYLKITTWANKSEISCFKNEKSPANKSWQGLKVLISGRIRT